MSDKIRKFCSKHSNVVAFVLGMITIVLILSIVRQAASLNTKPFFQWIANDHGDVADWVSGIGTFLAFLAIFWQVNKQTNIQRGLDAEHQRPRFSLVFIPVVRTGVTTIVFGEGQDGNKAKQLATNHSGYRKICINNMSPNTIYEIEVRLKYHLSSDPQGIREEYFLYSGLRPNHDLVLLPDFKFNESDEQIRYDHLTIRFDTSANEIGFCDYSGSHNKTHDSALSSEKYYFVRSKNRSISATAPDVMIKKKSKTYMNLNDGMDDANKHTSYENI